jgi:hypothetical protein
MLQLHREAADVEVESLGIGEVRLRRGFRQKTVAVRLGNFIALLSNNINISSISEEWCISERASSFLIFLPLEVLIFLFKFRFFLLLFKCLRVNSHKWFWLQCF